MLIPTRQSQQKPPREQEEAEMQAQLNESEQETLLRYQQAAAIYGIPEEWEREEVRQRVYSQYLRSYKELPPKEKRRSQPYSYEKFLEDFKFDWVSLCVRCKLCGTMNGWGGHHGIPCGKYDKQRPREFGWHGGCDLYEPIEPEFVQLDLFGTEEE